MRSIILMTSFLLLLASVDISADSSRWPKSSLSEMDAINLNPNQFISIDQHKAWQIDLDERGLRAAGSLAHESYIDALRLRLSEAGISEIYEEPVTLTQWKVNSWSLELPGKLPAENIPTANFVPYSGSTPEAGTIAPLKLADNYEKLKKGELKGRIAVVRLQKPETTLDIFARRALSLIGLNRPAAEIPFNRIYFATRKMAGVLDALQRADADGAIIVLDEPSNNAMGVYAPYDGYSRGVPAVYVDKDVGQRLVKLAQLGADARIKMDADVESVQSRNLVAIIPGSSEELVVLNSHTDGPNGIEDNGPNIIVAMAQYLARLPKEALPRSIMVSLTTGHFAGAKGVEDFIDQQRRSGLLDKISAVLCLEHLGAEEWVSGPGGRWMPSGRPEPYLFFMPNIPALVEASENAIRRAESAPTVISPPTRPNASGRAGRHHDHVWPGEAQAFWGRARIPTANYIAGPNYLFNSGISTADKVDYQRIHRETVAFTEMVLELSRLPFSELRGSFTERVEK